MFKSNNLLDLRIEYYYLAKKYKYKGNSALRMFEYKNRYEMITDKDIPDMEYRLLRVLDEAAYNNYDILLNDSYVFVINGYKCRDRFKALKMWFNKNGWEMKI